MAEFKSLMDDRASKLGMSRREYIELQTAARMEETGERYDVAKASFIGSVMFSIRKEKREASVAPVDVYLARPRRTENDHDDEDIAESVIDRTTT